jgi:hypothetical protein
MTYFIDYDKKLEQFLDSKGIKNVTGEADITCIEYDGDFEALMLEFKESANDTSIYPDGDGSRYHQSPTPIVKFSDNVVSILYKGRTLHVGYFVEDVLDRILCTSYYQLKSFLEGFDITNDEMMEDFASLILSQLGVSVDELDGMGRFDLNILSFNKKD